MASKNNKSKFPTAQTVLLIIAGLVALLTWFVPAGQYDRLSYNKETETFTRTHLKETVTLVASQKTLNDLKVKIPLEKFTNGDLWKPISIPGTYLKLEPRPQGLLAFIKSPFLIKKDEFQNLGNLSRTLPSRLRPSRLPECNPRY